MPEPGVFESEYGEAIGKVLATYPVGSPGLVYALEALCQTAYQQGHMKGRDSIAMNVCEQLHAGPPQGLKCLSCYNAEQGFAEEERVRAEIAAMKAETEGS